MGVVVQELVASRISGILFTQNPESANDRSLVVEYCFGLGDELAAGKLNPGRFVISREDYSWETQASPEQSGPLDDTLLLNPTQIASLADAALCLESHYGCPQDIEWTIDEGGQLYLVQTRPITVVATVKQLGGGLFNAETKSNPVVHWSNANVNENFPEPISPFLYSIASAGYYHYFRNLGLTLGFDPRRVAMMEYPLRNVIGVHGARMYYNLSNIHAILRMAPFGERLAEWFDDFVGADYPGAGELDTDGRSMGAEVCEFSKAYAPGRWTRMVELCRSGIKTTWQFLLISNRVAEFERVIDRFAEQTAPANLAEKSLSALLDDLRGFMDIRCHRWTNASLADTAAMVSYGLLKRMLGSDFPDLDQSGLHNSLLKGLCDVVSGIPIERLWHLSRMIRADAELEQLLASGEDETLLKQIRTKPQFAGFHAALEDFLVNWGFRCSGELMLTVESFQERPESLLEMLRAYVAIDGESPLDLLKRQSAERVEETAQVMGELRRRKLVWPLPWPTRATLVSIILKACHQSIALRERARLKQALLYSRCRRIALAIADRLVSLGVLESQGDVFFLTIQELESLLAGSAMFPYHTRQLVELRKDGHLQLGEMTPDDVFVLPAGDYLSSQPFSVDSDGESPVDGDDRVWGGVGACGGQVTAPAAILTDLSECRLLNQGDVLVTRQTDPGWGPVFFLIKGLVMERGGMLSHGAILAREYGIPTVVGVKDATRKISQGQRINVNGDRGSVQVVD